MGIISKIIRKSQKSRSLSLTDFAHPFCPYFTENFYRFMHNLRRCFCPRFSQKTLQLKGYFKVAEAIFPPLFTLKNFLSPSILEHRRTCDRTAPAALHRRPRIGLAAYNACPKRDKLIVSHLRSNGSNLHQNFKRRYTRQTPPSTGKTLPLARYSRARQSAPI